MFWIIILLNYVRAEGLRLWFVTINTGHVSLLVSLGGGSFLVHIGVIEFFLLVSSLVIFYLICRDFLLTTIFLFATTLSLEIGTFYFLYEYMNTFVTSVQVFWHLPLVTNFELLAASLEAVIILIPIWILLKISRRRNGMTLTG